MMVEKIELMQEVRVMVIVSINHALFCLCILISLVSLGFFLFGSWHIPKPLLGCSSSSSDFSVSDLSSSSLRPSVFVMTS